MIVYSHKPSNGGRDLAKALGGRKVNRYITRGAMKVIEAGNIPVINWGASRIPFRYEKVFNPPERVRFASNKRHFFDLMYGHGGHLIPKYWTNRNDVVEFMYLQDNPYIVARTVLNGHSGAGIVLANNPLELPDAPLYVEYKKKTSEFRVHTFKVGPYYKTWTNRKGRRHDVPDDQVNWQIRNHQNGFVFVRDITDVPERIIRDVEQAAVQTLEVFELDFGAVDVIWNEKEQRPYVLEVNTAPGLEGETLNQYVSFFREVV